MWHESNSHKFDFHFMFFSHFSLSDLFWCFNILQNMMLLWLENGQIKWKKNKCRIPAADESWKTEKKETVSTHYNKNKNNSNDKDNSPRLTIISVNLRNNCINLKVSRMQKFSIRFKIKINLNVDSFQYLRLTIGLQ